MAFPKERFLKNYHDMVLIRRFEEEIERYSKDGTIPGFIHLGIGQEAAQAGIVDVLRKTDYKFPDHRGHGAIVLSSYPEDRKRIMAEIFGKKTGINGGRGGSMHVHDLRVRNMGCNGIQGSTIVTSLGTSFAAVYNHTDDVTAVFIGDGTLGEGTCHESMNMAATW
jgi:TPP-dependent pyruvate/acetoin dehydrogenase alpha subunit